MAKGRHRVYEIIRNNWYATHSPAYLHWHNVVTEGVPPDFYNRTLFKPPPRSEAWMKAFNMMRFY